MPGTGGTVMLDGKPIRSAGPSTRSG